MPVNHDLLETLRDAQRFGFFGDAEIERAAAHAEQFVGAIGPLPEGSRIVDLGSGGGLPGLVVAEAFPACQVVLVDRRTKRTDFLERAVRRHRYDHVTVVADDAAAVIASVRSGTIRAFDVATARGFGPPAVTLRAAVALLNPAGRAVISEPPTGDRWDPDLLAELGLSVSPPGPIRTFQRFT